MVTGGFGGVCVEGTVEVKRGGLGREVWGGEWINLGGICKRRGEGVRVRKLGSGRRGNGSCCIHKQERACVSWFNNMADWVK